MEESTERWSQIKLKDGTTLRVKPIIVTVVRVKDQHDQEGNPLYVIKGSMAMAIEEAPKNLRKAV